MQQSAFGVAAAGDVHSDPFHNFLAQLDEMFTLLL